MNDLGATRDPATQEQKWYAGIGSRETPDAVLRQMRGLGTYLRERGYWLRSGGAKGADSAFEWSAGHSKRIYRPSDATPEAMKLAAKYHPNWSRCSPAAKALHARNGFQVLGDNLGDPSLFVACWTKDGMASGGTGQALRIAADYDIPIFNLHDPRAAYRLQDWVDARAF